MSESSINTLIGTFSSIDNITSNRIDSNSLICIDTSYNRIGINTIDPSYSIHIVDNSTDNSIGIFTPRLFLPSTRTLAETTKIGEVYIDISGFLKVRGNP